MENQLKKLNNLNKKRISFDHKISCEPKELKNLIEQINNVEKMLGTYKKNLNIKERKSRILLFKKKGRTTNGNMFNINYAGF